MSHRVTYKSELRDRDLTIQALAAIGCSYRNEGATKLVAIGSPLDGATIDLSTGEIVGDTDFHTRDQLGVLRQHYSEAEFRRMAILQGVTVETRQVTQEQVIELYCTTA